MLPMDPLLCWLLGTDARGAQGCLNSAMSCPAVGAMSECP